MKRGIALLWIIFMAATVSAETLRYMGDKQLCIRDPSNAVTCLSNNETYSYDGTKDYYATLQPAPRSEKISTLVELFLNNIVGIALAVSVVGVAAVLIGKGVGLI